MTTIACPTPHPTPTPVPLLSPLEQRAAIIREAYRYWSFTLATECPHSHAPLGQPCSPPLRGIGAGTICEERAVASARRAAGGVR